MATLEVKARPDTLAALRNANFRLYFAGQLISSAGTWMQNIAQAYLVFQITQDPLWSGIVACAAGLPLVLLSPISGVVVERVPRRELMLVTQTIQMFLAFILAVLVYAQVVQVWHIVLLAVLLGVTNAFDQPARQAIVFELVGRDDLHSGIALNSILNSSSRVLGPAAAGIALVKFGAATCFLLNGLSFLAVIASLALMKVPYAVHNISKISPLQQLREGLNYARRNEIIAPLLLLTATVGLFSLPIIQLYAPFAAQSLHSPEDGYAAISVAQGVGSVVAGIVVSWLAFRLGRGRLIVVMVILNTITTIVFALQTLIPPAVVFSAIAGLLIVCEVVCINTLIQSTVPNEFRGRVMALYALAFFGLAPFGALALGVAADLINSTANAIVLTGILGGVFGMAILLRWRELLQEA